MPLLYQTGCASDQTIQVNESFTRRLGEIASKYYRLTLKTAP